MQDDRIVSQHYEGGRIKSTDYQVGFDWTNRKLNFQKDETIDMPEGYVIANCAMWFAMSLARGEGLEDELVYSVEGRDKRIRGYRFQSLESETMETKIGTRSVLKLVLERERRPDRTLTFWLSKDDQYLPLQIQEKRESRTTTVSVEKLEKLN